MSKNSILGYLSALLFSLIIGLSFLFSKVALEFGNILDILSHRFIFALIAFSPFTYIYRKSLRINLKQLIVLLPISLFYPVLFFGLQLAGLTLTSSADGGIIQSFVPILVLFLSIIFLKKTTSLRQVVFIAISVFGVILIFTMQSNGIKSFNLTGLLLLFASTLSNAIYILLVKNKLSKVSVIQIIFVQIIFGTIIFSCCSIIYHLSSSMKTSFVTPLFNHSYLLAVLYLGILSSLSSSFLTVFALTKISAQTLSIFGNLATLVAILAGVIFLGESLTLVKLFGSVCIIIGVIGTTICSR